MAKFKVGDTVKIVNPDSTLKKIGYVEGQVVKVSAVTLTGYIQIDELLAGTNDGWLPSRFELVSREGEAPLIASSSNPSISAPLNDVECKSCHNKKCSSNERTCWLCGYIL